MEAPPRVLNQSFKSDQEDDDEEEEEEDEEEEGHGRLQDTV